jgi:hypothetical protein
MNPLDSSTRMLVMARGKALEWLREELRTLEVRIPLTEGCLRELVREADRGAIQTSAASALSYVERLKQQLSRCALFVQRWTGSDEQISAHSEEGLQSLVRIARSYSLPRPWKLAEPIVVEYRRMVPSYWRWASDLEARG